MSDGDLTIVIKVKQGPDAKFAEVTYDKPKGMKLAEVVGWLEQAKMDIMMSSLMKD